jgi:hypothetical protein
VRGDVAAEQAREVGEGCIQSQRVGSWPQAPGHDAADRNEPTDPYDYDDHSHDG